MIVVTGNMPYYAFDHSFTKRRSEIMKNAKTGSKKSIKAAQPRRVAGMPVRSGVKAGLHYRDDKLGGESRLGGPDIPGRMF